MVVGALGQPQLRGPHQPRHQDELPRVAAAGRRVRDRGHDGPRHHDRARWAPTRTATRSTCATSGRRRPRCRQTIDGASTPTCSPRGTPTSSPATRSGSRCRPPRATRSPGPRTRPTCASPRTSTACRARRRRSSTSPAHACSPSSATRSPPTTSARRATSRPARPAATYLTEHGVERKDFNSYGSRRGNHEVMIRGTFANIRLRNQLLDGVEGGYTRDFTQADAPQAFIYDAAQSYAAAGTPAGDPRGQGVRLGLLARLGRQGHRAARRRRPSSPSPTSASTARTSSAWACCRCSSRRAETPTRSVSTAPRRSRSPASPSSTRAARRAPLRVEAAKADGIVVAFDAVLRIDTPGEADYYRNGGILQYVLRSLV